MGANYSIEAGRSFVVSEAAATHGGTWLQYDASLPWTTSSRLVHPVKPLLRVVLGWGLIQAHSATTATSAIAAM